MPIARRDPPFTSLGRAQGARHRAEPGRRGLGPAVTNTPVSIPTGRSAHRPRPRPRPAGMLNRFGVALNARAPGALAPWRPPGVMRKCGTATPTTPGGIM
ncbi:hypothetical protein GCM10010495_65240 [Kitasatospora herbaricolor]|nr:hypothetical protein GCM10010495_65240 [Kitasatospora herbaricolor]